ncbi:MAG: homoprotocatechuate degradation operon regulator HpaR [Woeseiaceae bacterium]
MTRSKERAAPLRDFEHSLPMELLKARESAMARFRPMLRDHGLTEQQWRVIRALSALDSIDAGELARRSFLLAPSLTRILQHLESENLVTRSSDKYDQRRAVFSLTGKGKKLFSKVAPDSEALYADIEREFGVAKLESLYELLAEFYQTLDATHEQSEERSASV